MSSAAAAAAAPTVQIVWVGGLYVDDIYDAKEEIGCLKAVNVDFLIGQRKKVLENVLTNFGRYRLVAPVEWHLEKGFAFLTFSAEDAKEVVLSLDRFDKTGRSSGDREIRKQAFDDRLKAAVRDVGGFSLPPPAGKSNFKAAIQTSATKKPANQKEGQKPRGQGKPAAAGGAQTQKKAPNANGQPQPRPATAPTAAAAAAAGASPAAVVGGRAQGWASNPLKPQSQPQPQPQPQQTARPTQPKQQRASPQEDATVAQIQTNLQDIRKQSQLISSRVATENLMLAELEQKLSASVTQSDKLRAELAAAETQQTELKSRIAQIHQRQVSTSDSVRGLADREARLLADLKSAEEKSKKNSTA